MQKLAGNILGFRISKSQRLSNWGNGKYTEAQKRATQKYRSNNKDKVNEQRKKYYQQRKENDPEFLEYKRAKAREYYQRKKQSSNQEQPNDDMEGLEQLQLSALPAPPEPEPVVILLTVKFVVVAIKFVETLMFFTLSVAIVLLNVKLTLEPKEPASLN